MIASTSIDPYISSKEKRDQLEAVAMQYCQAKQLLSDRALPAIPDYLFTTDGCTRSPDDSWVSCCVVHDMTYWCGGSAEDRVEADRFLMQCANQKTTWVGGIMYPAVRVGGSPWLPTPWRWGYGWKQWPRGYQNPNHQDINTILTQQNILKKVEDQLK